MDPLIVIASFKAHAGALQCSSEIMCYRGSELSVSRSIRVAQVGEQGGGGSTTATDEIAEENERLAAEIAAMQSQLSPGASSPSTLVHKLPPPKVPFPVCLGCLKSLFVRIPPDS